jgi:hypothetical protein
MIAHYMVDTCVIAEKACKGTKYLYICKYPLKNSQLFFTNLSGCEVEFASGVLLGPDDIVG